MNDMTKRATVTIQKCFARAELKEEISPATLQEAAMLIGDLEAENARLRRALTEWGGEQAVSDALRTPEGVE